MSKWVYIDESEAKEMFESILDDQEFDPTEVGDVRGEGQVNEWSDYPNNYKIIYWADSQDCEYHLELQEINMEVA